MSSIEVIKGNVATAFLDKARIAALSSGWTILRTYSNGNDTTFVVVSRAVLGGQPADVVARRINAIPLSDVYVGSM